MTRIAIAIADDLRELHEHLRTSESVAREVTIDEQLDLPAFHRGARMDLNRIDAARWQRAAAMQHRETIEAVDAWLLADRRLRALEEVMRRAGVDEGMER
jgi:hypothetical protein